MSAVTKKKLSDFMMGRHISPTTEFKSGCVPWNKGIKRKGFRYAYHSSSNTKFKPGSRPWNWKPVGTVLIKFDNKTYEARHWIKVAEPNKWRCLAWEVWEFKTGRTRPKDCVIYHLNGIQLDDSPENLVCIPRSVAIKYMQIDHPEENKERLRKIREENPLRKYWHKRRLEEILKLGTL